MPTPTAANTAPSRRDEYLAVAAGRSESSRYETVTRWDLQSAILHLLNDAPRLGLFTGIERPVWGGWATPSMVQFNLPGSIRHARYLHYAGDGDFEGNFYVAEAMLELWEDGWLDRRVCLPFAHSKSPDVAAKQDWEFRLPNDSGYCYWTPSLPVSDHVRDHWAELVNHRHLTNLQELLADTDSDVPPYVLSRIERYHEWNPRRRVVLQ